jgi:hypothetical protein
MELRCFPQRPAYSSHHNSKSSFKSLDDVVAPRPMIAISRMQPQRMLWGVPALTTTMFYIADSEGKFKLHPAQRNPLFPPDNFLINQLRGMSDAYP